MPARAPGCAGQDPREQDSGETQRGPSRPRLRRADTRARGRRPRGAQGGGHSRGRKGVGRPPPWGTAASDRRRVTVSKTLAPRRGEEQEPRDGGVEGAPVGREAGVASLRSQSWGPRHPGLPGSGMESRSPEAGGGPLFSPSGERLGPPDVGAWCVGLWACPLFWVSGCPAHGPPLPTPLVCSSFFLWVSQTASPPDPESPSGVN